MKDRKLDHPDYLPIYETAADLGVVICVHEGARTILPQAGNDRYSEFGRHVACHPLEQMLACLTLRRWAPGAHPGAEGRPHGIGLRLAALLAGADGRALGALLPAAVRGTTKEPPSAYFKRQCFIS